MKATFQLPLQVTKHLYTLQRGDRFIWKADTWKVLSQLTPPFLHETQIQRLYDGYVQTIPDITLVTYIGS